MSIAIEYAIRSPDRVTGFVLEGCLAFTPEELEELGASYRLPPRVRLLRSLSSG
ncbi:MAG: hypothetical protein OXI75_17110 [Rhodospirillales bacterium]|nr:hypothetical protein [Rhodospirillales bacterium]